MAGWRRRSKRRGGADVSPLNGSHGVGYAVLALTSERGNGVCTAFLVYDNDIDLLTGTRWEK